MFYAARISLLTPSILVVLPWLSGRLNFAYIRN